MAKPKPCLGLLVGLVLLPLTLEAQVLGTGVTPVTEIGANLVQNTLQAVRSLISNANEVTSISNQVSSLANEARMLASLPMSLVDEINQAIQTYNLLLMQGQGISYQLKAATDAFENLYNGNQPFMQRAGRMREQIRAAGMMATTSSAIYDRLCAQQARVGRLLAGSQASIGQLQAQQAGNQLMGVMAEQQNSIQQILATEQRLKISESMRQLVIEEQAYQNMQLYTQGLVMMPVRGPGEGQGPTLPE